MLFLYDPVPSLVRQHDAAFGPFFDDDYAAPSLVRAKRPCAPLAVDQNFELSIDIPGVKQDDIRVTVDRNVLTIRGETKGDNRRLFRKVLTVDSDETDLSRLAAQLSSDGVLTLTAPPKAKPDPVQVTVTTSSEVDDDDSDERNDNDENETAPKTTTMMRRSIEVPGVKHSDLKVTLEEGTTLHVRGSRRGRAFHKSFRIDADRIDASELTATLSRGILTVRAPKVPPPRPQSVRIETAVGTATTPDCTTTATTTADDDETSDATVLVSMDMPGVRVQDVTVSTVRVDRHRTALDIRASRNHGGSSNVNVNKKLRISKLVLLDHDTYKVDELKAQLSDGVLTITATKKPDAVPRAVPIVAVTNEPSNAATVEECETTNGDGAGSA